ncbi:hypothetical protein [Nocardia sp. NPDC050406]|uniref:hypothetical protein n=1 Tax=Nocardia sp. NPDC050406 TaxID=3364318 RepID=UPI00379B4614
MSNPVQPNDHGHGPDSHLPEGVGEARFYTSYDDILDQVVFGVAFACGCGLMTPMSIEQALDVHDLFDAALLDALNHHNQKGN